MSTFPGSPLLVKGGIVTINPDNGAPLQIIALQYNPDTLTRTLQAQGIGGEPGDRLEALRLKGPPVETIKLEAEIDAADQLEQADKTDAGKLALQFGVLPQLAALEVLVYPSAIQLLRNDQRASFGTLEIAPAEAPLTLFVFGQNRIVPVRLTEFSITEEAFDPSLNPIRAKVSLGMRVLTVMDLGFAHRGGSLYMTYQQQKELLATKNAGGTLCTLGGIQIP